LKAGVSPGGESNLVGGTRGAIIQRFRSMAKQKKKSARAKRMVSEPRKAESRPFLALLFFAAAVLLFVAFWDFELDQSRQVSTSPESNLVGAFGAESGFWGFYLIGLAAWLVPVYLFWLGVRFLLRQNLRKRSSTVAAALVSLLCASGLGAMFEATGVIQAGEGLFAHQLPENAGGTLGRFLAEEALRPLIGPFGAFLVLVLGVFVTWVLIFTDNVARIADWGRNRWANLQERRANAKEARARAKEEKREAKRQKKEAAAEAKRSRRSGDKSDEPASDAATAGGSPSKKRAKAAAAKPSEEPAQEEAEGERKPSLLSRRPAPSLKRSDGRKAAQQKSASEPKNTKPILDEPETPDDAAAAPGSGEGAESAETAQPKPKLDAAAINPGKQVEKAKDPLPEIIGDYKVPPVDLLSQPGEAEVSTPEELQETMQELVQTLDQFGVKVTPGEIQTGPVITRYEVKPAPGVRVEKIANLEKNIALALKAMSVRILAPVPGKGTVGIEVPNRKPAAVCMREIVESRVWAENDAEIPIVLGKDVTGDPIVVDLTKMPHLLIAGSTGSGKTVCINAVIASLLYKYGPKDLRFLMVDPKVVEMQIYNDLPHMLIPVVTEAKKVPGALKWLIAEMDRRYQIFASEGVRNIAGFNAKVAKNKEEQKKAEEMEMTPEERNAANSVEVPRDDDAFEVPKEKLPYIVCVIDELADLMMVAPADVESGIARLAQLARAAGIHLILATQRPSVNVITGVIKANLPCRISFKVASKVDSRTILDGGGAESLIGKGDMLYVPPGASALTRAQGAFVSDDEINGIVEHIKQHNDKPVFSEEVQKQIDAGGDDANGAGSDSDSGGDELISDAIDVLRSTKRASTSMLQRRLRIGYNRAARLMEALEDQGIVGPEEGSKPREILVDLDSQ